MILHGYDIWNNDCRSVDIIYVFIYVSIFLITFRL